MYSSIIVFIICGFFSILFAFLSNKRLHTPICFFRKNTAESFSIVFFTLSFLCLWIIVAFTNIGGDYEGYYYDVIKYHNYDDIFKMINHIEPLMILSNTIIYNMSNNAHMVLFFLKTLNLLLFFVGFYCLRKDISLGFAVVGYFCLFYIQSFYLLSIYVAAAFVFLSSIFLVKYNKKITSLIFLVIAVGFHFSAMIMILPWLAYLIIFRTGMKFRRLLFLTFVIISFLSIFIATTFLNDLLNSIEILSRYNRYLGTDVEDVFGLYKYFQYVPIAILLYYSYKSNKNDQIINYAIIFSITGFTIKSLSSQIHMFCRIYVYFAFVFCVFVPYFIKKIRNNQYENRIRFLFDFNTTKLIVSAYFIILFVACVKQYMGIDNDAEMHFYSFFIPWN